MYCKILSLSNKGEWTKYFEMLPVYQHDVYYSPEYYQLYEENGDGLANCFVYKQEDRLALYPYLINSVSKLGYDLNDSYFDIQGAYGYNGVVSNSYDQDFIALFFKEFNNYCQEENIIAEFTRFNPINSNHRFESRYDPLYALDNVLIDISPEIDDIWMNSFDNGVRKAVKKGIRNELEYQSYRGDEITDELLQEFLDIYYSTMDRNNAGMYYYFSKNYFLRMRKLIPNRILFSFVRKNSKIISVELNLINQKNSYGFLGGTLADYFSLSPNSFLRFELIKDLKNRGIENYSIGGGITKNDSKYKFKKSFSKKIESKFYIGKKIHNQDIYENVIEQWEKKFKKEESNKLLRYREV